MTRAKSEALHGIFLNVALGVMLGGTLAACGGEEEVVCAQSDREGTYLFEAEDIGGDCGPMDPVLVQMRSGDQRVDGGCVVDYEQWSEDACKLERSLTCTSTADGLIFSGVAITEQQDSQGDVFDGTMSIGIYDLDTGATLCFGTYALTYTRQ